MKRFPTWLVLMFGIILGSTLTSTLTFHLWWCEQRTLNLVRGKASIPLTPQIARPTERCVCGEALEALETSNAEAVAHEVKGDTLIKSDSPAANLHPKVADVVGSKERALTLNGSEAATEGLLVAVLATRGGLEWMESVYETWGRDTNQLLMFVSDKFNTSHRSARGLPLVQLKGEGHPTGIDGSAVNLLSVVQYLADYHMTRNKWFMLAMEDSYVRIDKLQELLIQLNPKERIYLGRSAAGRKGETDKLGLKPHERYCLGSSGIVLSSALLSELAVPIETCQSDPSLPGDVALGKCVSRVLDMQCIQSNWVRETYHVCVC